MANLSVSKTSYEENLASVKGTFKYDSSGYTIINRPSDFTELIALSFPPGFIGINASGILIDRSPDGIWSLNSQGRVVYGSCKDDIILQKKYLLYDAIHRKDKELESLFRDELKLLEENLQGEEEHIFAFSDDLKLCYRSGEWMILSIYKPPVNFSDDDLKETSDDDKRKIGLSLFMSKKDTSQDAQQAAPAQQPQQQQQQQTQTSSSSSSAWSFMSSLKFGRKDTENAPPPERPPKPESLTIKAGEVSKTTPNPTPESSAPEQVAPAATPSSGDAPLAAHAAVASPQVAPAKASAEGSAEVHEGSKEEKKKGTGWSLFSKTLTDMKDTISSTLPKTMDEFLSSDEPDRPAQNTSEKETAVRGDASNAPPPVPPVPAAPAAMPADREPKEFKTLRSNVSLAEKEFKKAISEPGNDRVNKSIGIIIRAKVCYSIIIILSEHFKSERRFALTVYHLWDWIDSYSGIVSSSDAFDSIKATILSLNASSFKSDKNRKLRAFFCHAIK